MNKYHNGTKEQKAPYHCMCLGNCVIVYIVTIHINASHSKISKEKNKPLLLVLDFHRNSPFYYWKATNTFYNSERKHSRHYVTIAVELHICTKQN